MTRTSVFLRITLSVYCLVAPFLLKAEGEYQETYRPQFHFTPERNFMNDPNGMFYYKGEYHLFYQYNPFGNEWGHMSWGHAISRDLVHWSHQPVALREENGVMIFSGSAVVDWKNSSGFGSKREPPMVAIYTGHTSSNQHQSIAYSTDRGRSWTKYAFNPVLDIGKRDFRDPKVIWHKPSGQWLMVVSLPTEKKVQFYRSPDLKEWKFLSAFGPAGNSSGIWECPDFFPLKVKGEKLEKWVLLVNINPGGPAGGTACQYFLGDFDGTSFSADPAPPVTPKLGGQSDPGRYLDFGKDFFAAVTWSDMPGDDKSRVLLGWMSNWQYANQIPTHPWRSAQSMPRIIELVRTGRGLALTQAPPPAFRELRGNLARIAGRKLTDEGEISMPNVKGDVFEMIAEFDQINSDEFGIKVRSSQKEETVIGYSREHSEVFVDRTRSGRVDFHRDFAGHHAGSVQPSDRLKLHIFVDRSSVEVFVNDGELTITDLIFPDPGSQEIVLFSSSGSVNLKKLELWNLKSIWTGTNTASVRPRVRDTKGNYFP